MNKLFNDYIGNLYYILEDLEATENQKQLVKSMSRKLQNDIILVLNRTFNGMKTTPEQTGNFVDLDYFLGNIIDENNIDVWGVYNDRPKK